MPLPAQAVERELVHTRAFRFEGYRRSDGLWEVEGRIDDRKAADYPLESGVRRGGEAIHDMRVRVTFDAKFDIVEVHAVSDAVPYAGTCENFGDAYRRLIGLNLAKEFRKRLRELTGGVQGCTHITELLSALPSAAMQTYAAELRKQREQARASGDSSRPWQLDRCHAMSTSGELVRKWHPKWYVANTEEKGTA